MPDLSFHTWITIGLVISVVILLERSYRLIKHRDVEHLVIIDGLRSELLEVKQRLDTRTGVEEKKAKLGAIIEALRSSIREFVATKGSEEKRLALTALQNGVYTWLTENVGPAEAQAFIAATPSIPIPTSLPDKHMGPYQYASGRLVYLVNLVGTLDRG